MAAIQDLISQIENPELRERIGREVDKLVKQKKFGLVFEEHLPECTPLYDIPVKKGAKVALKTGKVSDFYTVLKIADGKALCLHQDRSTTSEFAVEDLVCVAEFGEPIYPYLKPLDTVCNAPDSDLWHTLIEADNYHALQLLEYLYAGKVDCIYIDPPYNTGARDWKYNNDYVDSADTYRHSKWLSFMQKRLKLAKRLLNPQESIMIITIDQNELHHLACLLEEIFPDAVRQTVTICITPSGASGDGLSRVEEYAIFVFIGSARPAMLDDDLLLPDSEKKADSIRWESLMRGGQSWYRKERPNLCYPVILSNDGTMITGVGEPLPYHADEALDIEEEHNRKLKDSDGHPYAWPLRSDGRLGIWRVDSQKLKWLAERGYIYVSSFDEARGSYTLRYILEGTITEIETGVVKRIGFGNRGEVILERQSSKLTIPKTIWMRSRHTAGGAAGTKLITDLLQKRNAFSFPKSLYAVEDSLKIAVINKPHALVIDFFAGSGTTLHAVNLLNAEDGGQRRCILVTNNEVSDAEAKEMASRRLKPGDEEWEKLGIARYVTWPRTVCSIKGQDVNGIPLKGKYLGSDRPMADGFKANAAYFKLGFLDKTKVSLGRQFKEMLPTLWMKAGAHGPCPTVEEGVPAMLILTENRMAILNDENQFSTFAAELAEHPEIEVVYLVTDYEAGFVAMSAALEGRQTYQLYRDYLDNFRINAGRNAR